jgi:DNA repair/transcription protein MET18/MMS19
VDFLPQELEEGFLTSADPFERAQGFSFSCFSYYIGVSLLSHVLSRCDATRVSSQAATVLIQFYLARLDDQASVGDLLMGVHALVAMGVVSKTDQLAIPTRIFAELNVQSHPQNVRYDIFRTFSLMLANNLDGVKKIQKDFIGGFIHCMSGEKDPRNLVILFKLAKEIVEHLDLFPNFSQDLFEVVFCYFPITFRPPPDDIYGITAEHLKESLRDVVVSSPLFAIHSIPVILEKLSSSSPSAKVFQSCFNRSEIQWILYLLVCQHILPLHLFLT